MADEQQSFPIVEQPMDADQWQSVTLGIGNGILDEGGFPYRLKSLSNSANTGVLQAAKRRDGTAFSAAVLNGFYHRLEGDLVLDFPAVTSSTTYHVVLEYDPKRTGMPVEAKVVTGLDYSEGKNYLPLYEVRRAPNQLLTDAVVRHVRPRVAPVQVYASEADMPAANTALWGTLALIHNGRAHGTGVLKMAITGDDSESTNGWFWKTVYDPDDTGFEWELKAYTASYEHPGHGHRRAIGRKGKTRQLRGRVSLSNDRVFSTSNDGYRVFSGGIPDADAPAAPQRFITACGNDTPTIATVTIGSDGDVVARVSRQTYWIGLDGIEWEAKS